MIDLRYPLIVFANWMPLSRIEVALSLALARKERDGKVVENDDLYAASLEIAGGGVGAAGRRRLLIRRMAALLYSQNVRFAYWRGKKDHEVDLVAEVGRELIPFEVKYRAQHTGLRDLKGLLELCQQVHQPLLRGDEIVG